VGLVGRTLNSYLEPQGLLLSAAKCVGSHSLQGRDPASAAQRELAEENGYGAALNTRQEYGARINAYRIVKDEAAGA